MEIIILSSLLYLLILDDFDYSFLEPWLTFIFLWNIVFSFLIKLFLIYYFFKGSLFIFSEFFCFFDKNDMSNIEKNDLTNFENKSEKKEEKSKIKISNDDLSQLNSNYEVNKI